MEGERKDPKRLKESKEGCTPDSPQSSARGAQKEGNVSCEHRGKERKENGQRGRVKE